MLSNIPSLSDKYRNILFGLIITAFLLISIFGAHTGALEWDEGSFLLNAEYFQGTDTNLEESRPHALSYAISLLWTVTGESTFAARLLIVLFGIGSMLLMHRIAAEEFDDPLPVTLSFAVTPLLLYWSFHVYTDVPALFFVLASYYLFRTEKHVLAGVAMAIALTVRYVFAVFAFGMALGYLIEHRESLYRYAVGGVLGAIPFFAYSAFSYSGVFSRMLMYVTRVTRWSGSGPFATTLASTWSALLMLAPLLPGAARGWQETSWVEKGMVLAYAAFFLFISGNSFTRYWLAIVPFLLLMGYRGLEHRKKLFVFSVAVMVVLSGNTVVANYSALQTCSEPFEDALGYVSERDGDVVSDRWAITGYVLDDRRVHSPWTDYETLRSNYSVTYAITTDALPYEREARFSNICRTYNVYNLNP